jgi:hypothetical protein
MCNKTDNNDRSPFSNAVVAPEKEGLRINYLKALNKENEDYAGNYKEIENNFQG